ncbi:MAG: hypothetical protein OEV58_14065 [Gammaproteobacteria bacterium]|nr:hypothetical protein [Gammaproteobacteria bacterium]
MMYFDPYGLYSSSDFINDAADFSAGFGDLISFGVTRRIRDYHGIGAVDPCSAFYSAGEYAGMAHGLATGIVGGSKAVARAASPTNWSNFSHSLVRHNTMSGSRNPVIRWLDRVGNRLNGDYLPVSRQFDLHGRIDPGARFGLDADWLLRNPLVNPIRQAANRIPYVPGAAAYVTGSNALNSSDCECQK